jgi:hypothetical protein
MKLLTARKSLVRKGGHWQEAIPIDTFVDEQSGITIGSICPQTLLDEGADVDEIISGRRIPVWIRKGTEMELAPEEEQRFVEDGYGEWIAEREDRPDVIHREGNPGPPTVNDALRRAAAAEAKVAELTARIERLEASMTTSATR